MPKISMIIPVYNTGDYLRQCVDSVISQTMTDIEIILVDDGSTDGVSPGICDEYAGKDERVKVIHKENGGLQSAWTCGVNNAKADYVCFIDSDDWVDTDMCEKLYARVDSSFADCEIISGNYIIEKAGERRKETQGLKPGVYLGKDLEAVRGKLLGCEVRPVTMSRCMKLISKKLILDNLQYCDSRIKMSEDVNITLPCLCDCKRLVIMEGAYFYHYRLVADSMAHGYDPKIMDNLELTDVTFRRILKEKGISNADEQLDKEYVRILFVVLKSELRCRDGNTVSRVRNLFLRKDIREKIKRADVDVFSKSNKLIYFCMRHPNAFVITFTKAVLWAFDARTNKVK